MERVNISNYWAYQYIHMSKILGAKRLAGFDKPTVWSVMTPLAVKTKSVNLVKHPYLCRVRDSPHGRHPISI